MFSPKKLRGENNSTLIQHTFDTVNSELLTHRKSECRKRSDFSFIVFRVNHCLSPNNELIPQGSLWDKVLILLCCLRLY